MSKHRLSTLKSGIRVVSEALDDSIRSVSLGLWIGAGSRDERPTQAGLTHFLEHLVFRGSARYSAQQVAELFDGLGGELNAATTREYTVLYARVLDEHLNLALDVVSDLVHRPTLAELEAERSVVMEEIASAEDAPHELVHDLVSSALFDEHPIGQPILGDATVIANANRRGLRAFHRSRYTPDNIVVAAAGRVDHDRLVRRVRRLSAEGTNTSARGRPNRRPYRKRGTPRALFRRKPTEQVHICAAGLGVSSSDPRRYAVSLLDTILGGSTSSRLFQEIREKRGLAYAVYTFGAQYEDAGEFGVYVGTREDNVDVCCQVIAEQFDDLASGGVTAAELQRAKDNLKGRIVLGLESTGSRMNRLGRSVVGNMEIKSIDQLIEEVEAVDADGIAELAAELLQVDSLAFAAIGPRARPVRAGIRQLNRDIEFEEAG
ncbi:MAG: M16 family metallopeptidase [Gaiellaceae bacterium]